MRIPCEVEYNNCDMVQCSAYFDHRYLVLSADEAFYTFAGKQIFEFDGIRIYESDPTRIIYHIGKYQEIPNLDGILEDQVFLDMFNGKHYFTAGNSEFLKVQHKKLYEETISCGICSILIFHFKTKSGKTVFFFLDKFTYAGRWSDVDRNYLYSLCKTIAMVME